MKKVKAIVVVGIVLITLSSCGTYYQGYTTRTNIFGQTVVTQQKDSFRKHKKRVKKIAKKRRKINKRQKCY